MYRRCTRIILFCFVLLIPLNCLAREKVLIAIVKTSELEAYNKAESGFKKVFLGDKNISVAYSEYIPKGNNEAILAKLRAEKPGIIFTIGTAASKIVSKNINDVPVVFCMVLDPSLIRSKENKNICGSTVQVPIETQCNFVNEIVPGSKKYGIIYTDRTQDYFTRMEAYGKKTGLQVIGKKISTSREFVEAFNDLSWRIDLLFMAPAPEIYTMPSVKYAIVNCIENKIALIGLSSLYTQAGALLSIDCDFEDNGRQAGEAALKVLNGARPADIPTAFPENYKLSINALTAKKIGVTISSIYLKKNIEVFGQ